MSKSLPSVGKGSDAMFSKFTEMTRHFAEMMERHRKEQLMAKKKTARSALSFASSDGSSAEISKIADSIHAGKKCGRNH